jgi:hypothetical protein
MKIQLWANGDSQVATCCCEEGNEVARCDMDDPRLLLEFEADSYREAFSKMHEFNGWEPWEE